jgi:aquaporin related protein
MPRFSTSILPLHKKEAGTDDTHHSTPAPAFTSKWRNELVAAASEFAGTFMFLFFAFGGTQVANTAAIYSDAATAGQEDGSITQAPNTSVLLFIALSFGFSLMVNVWVFFRVSGGLFNPAVSLSGLVPYFFSVCIRKEDTTSDSDFMQFIVEVVKLIPILRSRSVST